LLVYSQVGDGLEMYVVLAKGSPLQGLDTVHGITELTNIPGGERMFVIRRNLKRD
jgi:20S proteasome subunit beta 6